MRSRLALLLLPLSLAGCPDLPEPLAVDEEPPGADDLPDEVAMELPVCEGGVLNAFSSEAVQPPAAGSEGWLAPEADTLAAIRGSWTALMDSDPMLAVGMVAVVGYQLCRGEDDEDDLVLWRPAVQGTGRALFTWRFRDARGAVIETPHGFVDSDGHASALRVFELTGARGLVGSGTHPCANGESQLCGAGSAMCDGLPAASDAIVNDASIFQLAHELFSQSWPADWIISLQAMEDEGIALSDGTLSGSELGAASAIGGEIVASLPDMLVTSCNGLLGATPGRRYCGTELVQARHSNDAAEICSADAPDPSGRYLQITWSQEARAQADVVALAVDAGMAQDAR